MAISNTNILIKRSTTTATPSGLKAGELAYSYSSNTLFLGNSAGTGVVNIGGLLYTQTIDAATNLNTASTLVKRDASGNFSAGTITAALTGNASTASKWQTARNLSYTGDATGTNSVDGSGDVATALTLATVNSNVGNFGGSTQIPTFTVNGKGLITAVSNVAISSSFTVSGNTGSGTQNNGGTLTFQGSNGSGINTTVSGSGGNETVTFNTDTTIMRSNTTGSTQSIGTDVTISGNLTVTGATTYVNTAIIQTAESMIHLADQNIVGDVLDIGFVGQYNNGSANLATGLVRDAGSKNYYLFSGVAMSAVTGNTIANNLFTSSNTATLYANLNANTATITTANITNSTIGTLTLTNALAVPQGGTGAATFSSGQILVGNGTGALQSLANTGTAGTYGAANYIPIVTTDAYGRISSVANTQISIDASLITSGTLGYTRGGTGSTSYTTGALLVAGATGLQSLANSTFTATGTGATNNTITSVTTDVYGRTSALTYSAIAGLTVPQGGTGFSSATLNGIVFGSGTGALGVTVAAGTSDQTWSNQILTVTNLGVPVWSTAMDGGTF